MVGLQSGGLVSGVVAINPLTTNIILRQFIQLIYRINLFVDYFHLLAGDLTLFYCYGYP